MDSKNNILIVDDSNVIKKIMTIHLSKKGYKVFTASSVLEGASLLKKENIDLVITSINMPKISGLDFLLWLKKHNPKVKIIVMTAFSNEETKKFIVNNMGIGYFEKSSDYEQLYKIINKTLLDNNIDSEIKEINLFDFFYLIVLSNKNKVIQIQDRLKNQKGYIFFKQGNIVHAEYNNLKGENALYEMVKVLSGEFTDQDWFEPDNITINTSFDLLMLNLAKKINEDRKVLYKDKELLNSFSGSSIKKVAIFEQNTDISYFIKNIFQEKSFNVTEASNPDKFMEMIKENEFGLIICNLSFIEEKGLEFLLWLRRNDTGVRVLILSDKISEDSKSFAKKYSTISYLEKPYNVNQIHEYIELYLEDSFSGKLFSGNIKNISLFDFVKAIIISPKNRLILVKDQIYNRIGCLYIKNSNIIHCEFDNLQGEAAFISMSHNKGLFFSELTWNEPKIKTISINLKDLILKAVKSNENKSENIKLRSDIGTFVSSELSFLEQELEVIQSSPLNSLNQ